MIPLYEFKGSPREVGKQYGKIFREKIQKRVEEKHQELEQFIKDNGRGFKELQITAQRFFPDICQEIEGMAHTLNISVSYLLLMNYPHFQSAEDIECTNIAFCATSDGPVFGKNLDLYRGKDATRAYILRKVSYNLGYNLLHLTEPGLLLAHDGINETGLVLGGSSVGTRLQQYLSQPQVHFILYSVLKNQSSVKDTIYEVTRYSSLGKGYNILMLDAQGNARVFEWPSPLVQIRKPSSKRPNIIFCTNTYKLNTIANLHRRDEKGYQNAEARYAYLYQKLIENDTEFSLEGMKILLRSSGKEGNLCHPSHLGDHLITRLSIIASAKERKMWISDGSPRENPYVEYRIN